MSRPKDDNGKYVLAMQIQGICQKCHNFVLANEKFKWAEIKPTIKHMECK